MKILVDADALVALAKEDDSNHIRATKIAQRLKKETLYVTPLAIPEAATVLSYRVSQKAARQFLKEARQRKLIELPLATQASLLADETFLKQNKKGTSWIDCLNVAIVKIHNLDGIFSFDQFYNRFAKGKARFQASPDNLGKAVESLKEKTPDFQSGEAYQKFGLLKQTG